MSSQHASYDVCIIGAGIVGTCSGLALQKSGLKTCIIERDQTLRSASYGNAGLVAPWYIIPQSVPGLWKKVPGWLLKSDGPISLAPGYLPNLLPWARRFFQQSTAERVKATSKAMAALNENNIGLYQALLEEVDHSELMSENYFIQAFRHKDNAALSDLERSLRLQSGAVIEDVDGKTLRELEPAIGPRYEYAAVFKNSARALSPGKIRDVLLAQYQKLGGEVCFTRAEKLVQEAPGWRVETPNKRFSTDKLLLAAGPWSARLLKLLGIGVPLEAERGYHVSFDAPPNLLRHSTMDGDMKFVASSMLEGTRFAGTAEFAGLDAAPNTRRLNSILKSAKLMVPAIADYSAKHWMGIRPSLPDSLPCLGEVDGQPGLIAAFGHSHWGFMMAPKTAQIVNNIVCEEAAGIDLAPYRCTRFSPT